MKNQKLLIPVILVVAAVLVGFFLFFKGKAATSPEVSKNPFDSIKDAITKSLPMRCDYSTVDSKVIVYMKGSLVRMDGKWQGNSNSSMIVKDQQMWTWNIDKKEGIILPLKNQEGKDNFSQEELVNNLENQKQFCRVTTFSDDVFTPPTDVTFQDLGKLMENLQTPTTP